MFQIEHLLLPAEAAFVAGHALALVPELHLGSAHPGLDHASSRHRNRVEVRQHACTPAAAYRRKMDRGQLKTLLRQRQQMLAFQAHPRAHRVAALANDALLVTLAFCQQEGVQFFPTPHLRQRHQVVPPEVPVLPFHSAFLVSLSRRAKLRLETPMRPERNKAFRFLALRSAQNPFHRAREIVVPQFPEHPAKIGERQLMRLQERLLAGMRICPVKRSPAPHAAHAEQVRFLFLAIDLGNRLVPIHLPFLPPPIALRNVNLATRHPHFLLARSHVPPHRRLGKLHRWMLQPQSPPDPVRRVPLLPGRLPVCLQHLLDQRNHRRQLRTLPLRDLPRCRNRIPDRLPYHPPVHTELPRHPLDRSHAVFVLPAHLLEQLHFPLPPVQTGPPFGFNSRNRISGPCLVQGGAKSEYRSGPIQSSELSSVGALAFDWNRSTPHSSPACPCQGRGLWRGLLADRYCPKLLGEARVLRHRSTTCPGSRDAVP